jgi:hypothetical protein
VAVVSKATEAALYDALVAHLRDEDAIEANELLVAWVTSYAAVLPGVADAVRQGHSSPEAQHYYASHGLAAGLFAAFNHGIGSVDTGEGD